MLGTGVQQHRVTARLGLLQTRKQSPRIGCRVACHSIRCCVQQAHDLPREIHLIKVTASNTGNQGINRIRVTRRSPVLGPDGIRYACARRHRLHRVLPRQSRVKLRKPGQRAICGVGYQSSVKCGCRFIPHIAQTPGTGLRRLVCGFDYGTHIFGPFGNPAPQGLAKTIPQARRCSVNTARTACTSVKIEPGGNFSHGHALDSGLRGCPVEIDMHIDMRTEFALEIELR